MSPDPHPLLVFGGEAARGVDIDWQARTDHAHTFQQCRICREQAPVRVCPNGADCPLINIETYQGICPNCVALIKAMLPFVPDIEMRRFDDEPQG